MQDLLGTGKKKRGAVMDLLGIWRKERPLANREKEVFRGGLVFKAHRLLYHSTLDLRVIKKKKRSVGNRGKPVGNGEEEVGGQDRHHAHLLAPCRAATESFTMPKRNLVMA